MGLTGFMQESLLSLLCFDAEHGRKIGNLVPPDSWDGPYKRAAAQAVRYWGEFNEPPGEHTLDFFTGLERDDKSRAAEYRRLYASLLETRGTINAKYVMGQVASFLREQRLRRGIVEAVDQLEQGKPGDAEQTIRKSLEGAIDVFHPGLLFHEVRVADLTAEQHDALPTGIPMLDERQLGPTPGELSLFIAPPNAGKSWWLIHLGKYALAAHKRVVHVTLEMDERRVAQRYLQAFCAVSKRQEDIFNATFQENELGQLLEIRRKKIKGVKSFADDGIEAKLNRQLKKFSRRSPLVIRQFPTGLLTMQGLRAYLDSLEAQQKIVPDLLLVDYADLMSTGTKDYRLELMAIYKELRGLAVERNIAVATASQTNRESAGKKTITGRGVAEDWSKIATCDTILTYNQTEAEMRLGTARLYVDKGRNEEGKFMVLITQNYKIGQFCLDSRRMASQRYWQLVNEHAPGPGGREML
jgi:replicative DNA helicase